MATLDPSDEIPSKSPGNEGSRGSRGMGNAGAQDDAQGQRSPAEGADEAGSDDADARGGGGIGSNSGRSK